MSERSTIWAVRPYFSAPNQSFTCTRSISYVARHANYHRGLALFAVDTFPMAHCGSLADHSARNPAMLDPAAFPKSGRAAHADLRLDSEMFRTILVWLLLWLWHRPTPNRTVPHRITKACATFTSTFIWIVLHWIRTWGAWNPINLSKIPALHHANGRCAVKSILSKSRYFNRLLLPLAYGNRTHTHSGGHTRTRTIRWILITSSANEFPEETWGKNTRCRQVHNNTYHAHGKCFKLKIGTENFHSSKRTRSSLPIHSIAWVKSNEYHIWCKRAIFFCSACVLASFWFCFKSNIIAAHNICWNARSRRHWK